MKLSLRKVMADAVESYPNQPRQEWVLNWPGQVVLASSIVHWTAEVTQVCVKLILISLKIEASKYVIYSIVAAVASCVHLICVMQMLMLCHTVWYYLEMYRIHFFFRIPDIEYYLDIKFHRIPDNIG